MQATRRRAGAITLTRRAPQRREKRADPCDRIEAIGSFLCDMLFGGLHQISWYHSHLIVSRNAPSEPILHYRPIVSVMLAVLCFLAPRLRAGELLLPVDSATNSRVLTMFSPEAIEAYVPR